MEVHEAANIFPIEEDTINDLADDIRTHGQKVPIEILDGKILDGRRRYLACEKAGVQPVTVAVQVDDPVAYVLSLNLHRRHLSESQRAMVGARAKAWYTEQAKERQRDHGGTAPGKKKTLPANLPEVNSGDARDLVGKTVGVSGKSIDFASRVLRQGTEEVIKAVEEDRLAVSTAARLTQYRPEIQDELASKAKGRPNQRKKSEVPMPEETPIDHVESEEPEIRGVGVFKAHEAIAILKSIPHNDPLRKRGFQIVEDYLAYNRRA